MKSFRVHTNRSDGHTLVSDVFLDEYMPSANGEYVKIYLHLLRCLKSDAPELSVTSIADRFERTESDVKRALKYWEKMKLLKLEYDNSRELVGICLLEQDSAGEDFVSEEAAAGRPDTAAPASACIAVAGEKPSHTAAFTQEEARQLLFICEQYLGKTLSSTDVSKIMFFHDSLGFSADLIEYLIEYCVSRRHKSMRYIESVALGWHRDGYTTVAQAKEQTNTYNRAYYSILKAFGIGSRNPVDVEIAYMDKWLKEYAFSTELITEACSRTMAAIHQPGFEYADKILSGWHENGVRTPKDLEALDARRRSSAKPDPASSKKSAAPNRFHNFHQRDYDYGELEKKLINN